MNYTRLMPFPFPFLSLSLSLSLSFSLFLSVHLIPFPRSRSAVGGGSEEAFAGWIWWQLWDLGEIIKKNLRVRVRVSVCSHHFQEALSSSYIQMSTCPLISVHKPYHSQLNSITPPNLSCCGAGDTKGKAGVEKKEYPSTSLLKMCSVSFIVARWLSNNKYLKWPT